MVPADQHAFEIDEPSIQSRHPGSNPTYFGFALYNYILSAIHKDTFCNLISAIQHLLVD